MTLPDLLLVIPPSFGVTAAPIAAAPTAAVPVASHHEATSGMGALASGPRPFLYPPHTVALCADAAQKAGLRVGVIDAVGGKLTATAALREIWELRAGLVAVLTSQGTASADAHFLRQLRIDCGDLPILSFGPSAFCAGESFLAEGLADGVLLGEPEAALVEAVTALAGGRGGLLAAGELAPSRYDAGNLIRDLDSLPFPAWRLVDWQPYGAVSLLSSRGCPAGCAYCAYVLSQGRRFRAQSPERTVEELAQTAAATGGARIQVRDPVFAHDPGRVAAICEGILARRLKLSFACESRPEQLSDDLLAALAAAGCSTVKIGLESGDPDLLQRLHRVQPGASERYIAEAVRVGRMCGRLGIACQVFVMAGLPGQDDASLACTRAALRRLPESAIIRVKPYSAHPGVELDAPSARVPEETLGWLEAANAPGSVRLRQRAAAIWRRIRPASLPAVPQAPPLPKQHLLPRDHPLAGQRVFLTGGNGFLGGHVARALVAGGATVVALVRPGSQLGVLDQLPVEVLRGDLREFATWEHGLQGCAFCFHVAALYASAGAIEALYEINVSGTDRLLAACARHGVRRVIHTSTVGTVGRPADPRLLPDEGVPFDGWEHTSDYVRSKLLGERAALDWRGAGLEVVVVKPTAPVGAGDARPTATGRRILAALRGEVTPYPAGGINHAPARDIAAGMLLAAERGRPGETYILGHRDGNLDQAAFLARVAEAAGAPPLRPPAVLRTSTPLTALTVNPARGVVELGMPQSDLRAAFAEAVAWYREGDYGSTS